MLFQIAVLAWVFLGERLSDPEIFGMLLAALGTLAVHVHRR
jgi:drug/metabolite transporter (DMT)-like permease